MQSWIGATEEEAKRGFAIFTLFYSDPELFEYFFINHGMNLSLRPGLMHEALWQFNRNDQSLIKAALDLWSGNGHLYLFEMLADWDERSWVNFIKAIRILKNISLDDLRGEKELKIPGLQELF